MSSLDEHVDALFENLPDDPQQRLDAVSKVYAVIRERAAKHLLPPIREILQHPDRLNYEQKLNAARQINRALHDARLAIVDPVTQLPSLITPNRPTPTSHVSRFYLKDSRNGADGKRHIMILKDHVASEITLVALSSAEEKSPSR